MTDNNVLADLLADGALAAVNFHTGGASRSTRAFIGELATALANATPRKPLVITTDHALIALYRRWGILELTNSNGRKMTMTGGRRFADLEGYAAGAYLSAEFAGDKQSDGITLPDGGKWLDGRTPENTPRHTLPTFDTTRVSRAVEQLLDSWAASGKLVNIDAAPVVPQRSAVEPVYSGEPDLRSPADIDPTDPIRSIPGAMDDLRERRRAAGLVDTVRQRVISAADILRGIR